MAKRQALKPQPAGTPAPKYDVAISFLARDEQVAERLQTSSGGAERLLFPAQAEELAGTNGSCRCASRSLMLLSSSSTGSRGEGPNGRALKKRQSLIAA
jgi:hypothetical protein